MLRCLFVAGETKRDGEMVSRLERVGGGVEVEGFFDTVQITLPDNDPPLSPTSPWFLHSSLQRQPSILPFNSRIFRSGFDGFVDAIGCEGTRYLENTCFSIHDHCFLYEKARYDLMEQKSTTLSLFVYSMLHQFRVTINEFLHFESINIIFIFS